jgi:hypothetical protein
MEQKTWNNNILKALLMCVLCFMFYLPEVNAQQLSLSITPPLVEMVIKPGKSLLIAYTLTNYGDPLIMKSYVLPFEARDELGNIRLKNRFEGPIRFNLDNSEISLNQSYVLKSGGSQQLLLFIRVPEGAPEGDYYYTFLSESQPPPTIEGVALSRSKASIGANLLITVTNSGHTDYKAAVTGFDVLPRYKLSLFNKTLNLIDSSDIVPIKLIVTNYGKNVVKPQGSIELNSTFGEKSSYEILPQNILSNGQRLLSATPSASIDCETNTKQKACSQPFTLILKSFFIGRYSLNAIINFGEDTPTIYGSATFLALPLKFILACVIVLSAVVLVLRIRR